MKRLKERCKNQAVLLTLLNKYDFKPSSIIDFNLGSFIFPDIKDHGLPTPTSKKTPSPGTCRPRNTSKDGQEYLESEEMQNPMRDKLTFNGKGKMTIVCRFFEYLSHNTQSQF